MDNKRNIDSIVMFINGKLNISATILISLRDKECSIVRSKTRFNINSHPLSFIVRLKKQQDLVKLNWRVAKWQKNKKIESDIRIKDAALENTPIKINLKNTGLNLSHFKQKINSKTSQWTFVMDNITFSYSIDMKEARTYYRLTEVANVLERELNGFEIRGGKPVFCHYKTEFILNGESFFLFYEMHGKNKRMFIETNGDVNSLCSLLSFYAGAMIEWDMQITDADGNRTIKVREPFYKNLSERICNEPLKYIVTNKDCLDNLYVFQEGIVSNGTKMDDDLSQNIELYTRASLLDNRSRFITYYSILEKMGNDNGGVEISQYLKDKNIDYDNLSCGISSKGIKNHEGNVIQNIRDLRNEILHHIGSSQIDKFMRESAIIARMQYAACIVILWKIGFKNIRFIKPWEDLSVFNNQVRPYDCSID